MSCGNKIKRKQFEPTVYTTEANEFTNLNPTATPALADHLLIEDASDGENKKGVTIQQIVDLVNVSSSLPLYYYINDESYNIHVDTTPKVILTLTTPSIPAGTYRIAFSYSWNSGREHRHLNSNIKLDTVVKRHMRSPPISSDLPGISNTCSDDEYICTGFFVVVFNSDGIHTVTLDIATDDTTYQVSVWNKTIEIQRVA